MSSPLRKRMRSPGFRPALSAGLPAEKQNEIRSNSSDNKELDQTGLNFIYTIVIISNTSFYLTGDDRVDPHWSVASQGEAKTHVAFTHSDCPKNTSLKELQRQMMQKKRKYQNKVSSAYLTCSSSSLRKYRVLENL